MTNDQPVGRVAGAPVIPPVLTPASATWSRATPARLQPVSVCAPSTTLAVTRLAVAHDHAEVGGGRGADDALRAQAVELGTGEVGARQLRAHQLRTHEVGAGEVRSREVGAAEVGAVQERGRQRVGTGEGDVDEREVLQVGVLQVGAVEVDATEQRRAVGAAVDSDQVAVGDREEVGERRRCTDDLLRSSPHPSWRCRGWCRARLVPVIVARSNLALVKSVPPGWRR